jgi:hypothetical protein
MEQRTVHAAFKAVLLPTLASILITCPPPAGQPSVTAYITKGRGKTPAPCPVEALEIIDALDYRAAMADSRSEVRALWLSPHLDVTWAWRPQGLISASRTGPPVHA